MNAAMVRRTVAGAAAVTAALCAAWAYFPFTPAVQETVNDQLPAGGNTAPVVEELTGETFDLVPVSWSLTALDAEGDAVLFRVSTPPDTGEASIRDGVLTYTPEEGQRGTVTFAYEAVDTGAARSEPAAVTVKVERYSGETYADLDGEPCQYAALRLTELGALDGTRVGQSTLLLPHQVISRNELTVLAVQAAGLRVSDQAQTSFLDDEDIASWARPYVAAAQRAGAVNGYPAQDGTAVWQGDQTVTRAEAALILARLGDAPRVSVLTGDSAVDGVPAWALTGAALLQALPGEEDAQAALTRGEAVQLTWQALGEESLANS